ncbi:MAG: alpha-galactosidase [Clostridia bacterium]|nr:alpha-galactosidase [Clostridia bacterium]
MAEIKKFLRKHKICPVCTVKKLAAATQIHIDGADRFYNGTALTPPMGWASWNLFRNHINENLIEDIAAAMQKSGLADCGYQYVNIDDCWMSSTRDADGRLQGDLGTFPHGIKALAEKVNALGLKLGIYTSNGTLTCEDLPSSLYHERTDAETFAEWGIEYFKYDFCHNIPIPTNAPEISTVTITKQGCHEGITLHAEEAELRGDAILLTDEKMAGTGRYVSGLEAGRGSMYFNNVDIDEDGTYALTLCLHKTGLKDKYLEIEINDTDVYTLTEPGTKGFTPDGRNQITVKLKAGKNSFKFHNPVASKMDSAAKQYRKMGKELQRATKLVAEREGREEKPICFSICEWGWNKPWIWGHTAGNLWRTTPDIKPIWLSIIGIYERTVLLYKHAGVGNWNDPDMLEVGNGNLTDDENRAHFSLWCMLAAPLILGNDLRKFIRADGSVDTDNKVLKIISNKAAIAVNQDPRGIQCRRVKTNAVTDVLVKPLENKEIAVCLLNKGPVEAEVSFNISDIIKEAFVDLPKAGEYEAFDIWEEKEFRIRNSYKTKLRPHSVGLYRIKAI